jgi:hypothetical protein
MATCYVCVSRGELSPDQSAIGCCSKCGAFACIYDSARIHGKADFECAICLVRVILHSAGVPYPSGDGGGGGGGGGIGVAMVETEAQAQFREYTGTEHFERDCRALALASKAHRYAWRGLLLEHLPGHTARELGQRLEAIVGNEAGLGERIEEGIRNDALNRELVADAVGVGEYALLRSDTKTGPSTLESVAHQEALERDLAARSVPEREVVVEETIGAYKAEQAKEEKKEEKKYMTMGE